MIIEADANGIRRSTVNDNYILAYVGLDIITIQLNDNSITHTIHNLESFHDGRALADRVLELGLNFLLEHMLLAKEFGVEFQPENEQKFLDSIWVHGTEEEQERAIALGYKKPTEQEA